MRFPALNFFSYLYGVKRAWAIIAALLLTLAATGTERKALLLFVQFKDLQFTADATQFQGLADSLTLYFNAQFHGNPEFSFTKGPLITIDENHAYYGANSTSGADVQMFHAVVQACQQAAYSLSLAEFINPPAPELRDLLVLVPGKSEIDSLDNSLFRPQFVNIKGTYTAAKYKIACYGIACELGEDGEFTGIGYLAHEYGHILGLPDWYDTDGDRSGGVSPALWGKFALMDDGNRNCGGHRPPNFCAPDYYTLGAGIGEVIDTVGSYTLEPIDEQGRFFIFEGPRSGEVFLAESRLDRGWDTLIGGRGLAIYHYDRSDGPAGWSDWDGRNLTAAERWEKNRVNCNPAHQCVELQAPDTLSPFFPSGPLESFASETSPSFRFWDGTISPLAISGITQGPDGVVTFNLTRPISGLGVIPFQNSVILSWKCDSAITGIDSCKVVCTKGVDTLAVTKGTLIEENRWSCTLGGLSPATTYKVTVYIMKNGSPFFSAAISASTLSMRSGSIPFIYVKGADRGRDGSFRPGARIPLQVFNASGVESIVWYWNGSEVQAEADGLFTIPGSGVLKAEVFLKDGSVDYLQKEITVR